MTTFARRIAALALTCGVVLAATHSLPARGQEILRLEVGVTADGIATDRWLAAVRERLSDGEFAAASHMRRPLSTSESTWVEVIGSRLPTWRGQTADVALPYRPVKRPELATIVLGNRGGSDAFTPDSLTIAFDLRALHEAYGDANREENGDRIDRLFRHEYAHLVQKAWLREHPFPVTEPVEAALLDIWLEGLGNYLSLSDRWRSTDGSRSATAAATLESLEPRFVARIAALSCATPPNAALLLADLSSGPFNEKWGALAAALWLDAEASVDADAIGRFVAAGPSGVWDLADRHLDPGLGATLREARSVDALCDFASTDTTRNWIQRK